MAEQKPGEIFGERLRHRRMECHMNQTQLAAKLEEPQGYISRWESGQIEYMTLARLRRLADILHTTVDYLVGRTDDPRDTRLERRPRDSRSQRLRESEVFPHVSAPASV